MSSWPWPPKPPKPPKQPSVRTVNAKAWIDGTTTGIPGATIAVNNEHYTAGQVTNPDGIVWFLNVPESVRYFNLKAQAEGYATVQTRVEVGSGEYLIPPILLSPLHVDPSRFSLEELANIRGAMWTCRWNGPLGPRPGDPTNILAMEFLQCYGAADRAEMFRIYKSRGYDTAALEPIVGSDGYHGYWPPTDWRGHFDDYLDLLQRFWDEGVKPTCWIHPDNWTLEQTKELTPLFQSERAQRLMRIIVPTGWEPTRYGWSSWTWAEYCKWARQTWPNALILIHTVVDVDAPVGTDERGNDDDKNQNPTGNAGGWSRVCPHIHGWLTQTGGFPNPAIFPAWKDLWNPNVRGSYPDRFRNGYAGWPTSSAWGPNTPIKIYASEFAAYESFWNNVPEIESQRWGDAALAAGADGSLDGCFAKE